MFNNVRNRKELYRRFAQVGFKIGCEIGVHKGENALSMFKNIPELEFNCTQEKSPSWYFVRR
jgi:hypothetical protein